MSKSWNKRAEKNGREVKRLQSLRRYLIVCEDAKSSRLYLLAFPYDRALVQIESEGGCGETLSVVNRGIELRNEAIKAGTPFVETYCVIDRDDHPVDRYRSAFEVANEYNDVHVIWANEAFELWYLLHYELLNAGLRRELLNQKLSKRLVRPPIRAMLLKQRNYGLGRLTKFRQQLFFVSKKSDISACMPK